MNVRELRKLFDVFRENDAEEIRFCQGGMTVTMIKGEPSPALSEPEVRFEPQMNISLQEKTEIEPEPPIPDNAICSRWVGTFLRGTAAGKKPFVEVGDFVPRGQLVGAVDVIGTRHDIKADRDGTVRAILVEDGKAVQYNQPVLIIG